VSPAPVQKLSSKMKLTRLQPWTRGLACLK